MNAKTVCPPKCPGRCPGCGANCETFKQHRAECAKRYAANAERRKLDELTEKAVRERMRQMRRKKKAI